MPPSALDQLARLHIQYPMLFKLTNKKMKRETHCGVLEFVADEGRIYIPYWMMKNLLLTEGDLIQVENVSLSIATFAKFQPQSTDFLDISNPKAVLENALRSFACLTKEDLIEFKYNDKIYELRVLETKPGNAVSIIECDMNVDFAPPIGYKEPEVKKTHEEHEEKMEETAVEPDIDNSFKLFQGKGNRLDGKNKGLDAPEHLSAMTAVKRGIPNYNHKKGTITFIRTSKPVVNGNGNMEEKDAFSAFSGEGQSLRKAKPKGRR